MAERSRLTMRWKISFSQGMAARKQISRVLTTGKTASGETTGEVSAKKRVTKNANKPGKGPAPKTLPLHDKCNPRVLADLAIKILHLRSGSGTAAGTQSVRLDDVGLHDALDDARRFLLAAKGVIDEDVDAYRLFSEDDGLMSFDDIAERFSLRKWNLMTSRNKVEETIEGLVISAEKKVQKEQEKYEALVSVRNGYAGGVYALVDRVRERIRAMVGDLELEGLFSNPDQVSEVMGQFFLHLMGKDITEDWERHLDEEFASAAGLRSFIEYVCGGMTYEQFIPKGPDVRMDPERLACLKFFLENVDAWVISDYKAKAKDLNTLMRFIRGRAPASIVGHLESFLKMLRKTPVKEEPVKQLAKAAHEELKKFCERMHLAKVVKVQEWHSLTIMLGMFSGPTSPFEQLPVEKIKCLHNLLQQTEESVQNLDFEPTEIRAKLNELREELAEASSMLEAEKAQGIAVEMDKVAEGLQRGLRMERILPMDLELALENLLADLTPHKGARKCRPYELFLFAAQNRLCREDLIRKRSSLVPGVITGPPHSGSLSILMSHRGAEIAMGI